MFGISFPTVDMTRLQTFEVKTATEHKLERKSSLYDLKNTWNMMDGEAKQERVK